jgi:pyridoxamine 5'-phosphate oxidase
MQMEKLLEARREYTSRPLDEKSVNDDPFKQFELWFAEAVHAGQMDPEAMTLATSSGDGRVSARIVLLRGCDQRGFAFYTNYSSRKAQDLEEKRSASLVFYWATLNRQVRIEGEVEKVDVAESEAYFRSRPRGSQLAAWASPQSDVIESREDLESRFAEVEKRFEDREVTRPPFWGGYRVQPTSIEFWQGRESRLHDRILYRRNEQGNWTRTRLAP